MDDEEREIDEQIDEWMSGWMDGCVGRWEDRLINN